MTNPKDSIATLVPSNARAPLYFALRLLLFFSLLLMPWPYLADAYVTAFDKASNIVLWAADDGSRIGFRFEAPEEFRSKGTWDAILRVEDRLTSQVAHMRIGARTFSYRPMATFFALIAAAQLKGWRRSVIVAGAGLLLMFIATSMLAYLATLRFGVARVLGMQHQDLIETGYEALTTPAMQYAVPILIFWLLVVLTNKRNALAAGETSRAD